MNYCGTWWADGIAACHVTGGWQVRIYLEKLCIDLEQVAHPQMSVRNQFHYYHHFIIMIHPYQHQPSSSPSTAAAAETFIMKKRK